MSSLPFDFKSDYLQTDPVRGYPALHDDARDMLFFIAETCEQQKMPRPLVTCFGRTKSDQESIYLPMMRQQLSHHGVVDAAAFYAAKEQARARFSWHCLALPKMLSRAFDLRDWIYSESARDLIIRAVRNKYPQAEILDHAVPGGARHFHFGLPAPERPLEWI